MPFASNQKLLETVEDFRRYDFTNSSGATVTNYDAVPKGELFMLSLDRQARKRFVWVAVGSFAHEYTVRWFAQACLCFFLNGNKVGEYLFGDASKQITSAERAVAPRTILRIGADGLGSQQPVIRYQESLSGSLDRDNLDMGCISMEVEADSVSFNVLGVGYVTPNLNTLKLLLGARVVSTR